MKRELWKLTDDQVWRLREEAHALLRELYVAYESWQAYATAQAEHASLGFKGSVITNKCASNARAAERRLRQIEERIGEQRYFCNQLDNEFMHRNPPFWTRADLDAMDSNRRNR